MVVALNMMDIAERRGLHLSPEKLEAELGVPVVPVVGHKRKGIEELKSAVAKATIAPMPDWPLPQAMKEEVLLVGGGLSILQSPDGATREGEAPAEPSSSMPNRLGSAGASPSRGRRLPLDNYKALAERLLIGDRAADIEPLSTQAPVSTLLNSAATRLSHLGIDPMQADIE